MSALQRSQLPAFKRRYRDVDVLLLEDVQFLEGKDKTAEEFFYTVDSIINRGAQLVLSVEGRTVGQIFGSPDDLKLRSSMTLFEAVAPGATVFAEVLDRYYGGGRDEITLRALQS